MITSESFTSDPDQVNRLIRWWIIQSKSRYHQVRCRGSVNDFIHDVWCAMLFNFRNGKTVDFKLSTVIISHCRWVLYRNASDTKYDRGKRIFQYKMRIARTAKPDDSLGGDEEPVEYIHAKEFDDALAWVMRTLTFREAVVIRARYGLFGDPELTLENLGAALKVTRERIRQIEGKALKKIQHYSRARRLIPFVDELATQREEQKIDERKAKRMQKTVYGKALFDELTKGD